MSIISKLATSLNRRDEVPNQELARQLVKKKDKEGIRELMDLLPGKNKDIQNDCIKVLYEIGEQDPALIAPYLKDFVALLTSKNNRLQWGAMAAIDAITAVDTKAVYALIPKIISAANNGSVITRDHAVNILVKLCSIRQYSADAFSLLLEQFLISPANQLAMYAERALPAINDKNKPEFIRVLKTRMPDIEKDTIKKRIEKVIKKLS